MATTERRGEKVIAGESFTDRYTFFHRTTFDIIGDLTFGEPFGCLQNLQTQNYVGLLVESLEAFPVLYAMRYFPWIKRLGSLVVDQSRLAKRQEYREWVTSRVQKRTQQETQRSDFMTEILGDHGEKGEALSDDELVSNAQVLVTAGSETTATLLSGATYLLLKNPEVMQKLKDEVRGRWKSYDEIALRSVNEAPYLVAVISEALRYYPPVPTGFYRRVPPGGEIISGVFIPEGTSVAVSSYPTHHTERNFKDPEAFIPERWMGDAEYADDLRSSCQPFSFGPRACLGKVRNNSSMYNPESSKQGLTSTQNLAYAEMRLILAKMIWSFDFKLDPASENWLKENKVFGIWKKPALSVHMKEVVRA